MYLRGKKPKLYMSERECLFWKNCQCVAHQKLILTVRFIRLLKLQDIIILLANKHGCYNLETMELNLLNLHLRLQNIGHHCQINPNAFWVQRIIVNTIAVPAHLSHFFLAVSYQAPKSGNCWLWIKGNLLFLLSPHIFFKSLSLKQMYFLIQPFTHTLV